jgi:hypothetical protein
MFEPEMPAGVVFLVCVETTGGAERAGFRRRLDAWNARRCLAQCWVIPAQTTARIVYESLAEELDDRDRLLVSELDPEAVSFNLRTEWRDVVRRRRMGGRATSAAE